MVTHKPTELVVSTGKAEFTPLTDDLLAMSNTDSDVFMDVKSQKYYLIISGRWYKADSMTGTWQYVAADKLPATFVEIPKILNIQMYKLPLQEQTRSGRQEK